MYYENRLAYGIYFAMFYVKIELHLKVILELGLYAKIALAQASILS
jgi:hypothetical protein